MAKLEQRGKRGSFKVNYREENIPPYTLPDALVMNNGSKVSSVKSWQELCLHWKVPFKRGVSATTFAPVALDSSITTGSVISISPARPGNIWAKISEKAYQNVFMLSSGISTVDRQCFCSGPKQNLSIAIRFTGQSAYAEPVFEA